MSFANIWPFIISPIIGFLIGSFPTAYIVTKLVAGIDPRKFGSGSVSTRNTIRAAGLFPWGAITFSVDGIKGMLAVAIVEYLIAPFAANPITFTEFYCIICAVTAVAGHCWMPYLGFKGGKGLGTYVGLLFYFYWPVAFIWIFLLFAMIKITGFAGYGACWAVSLVVPVLYFFDVLTQTLGLGKLPLDFWPHIYLNDTLTSNGPLGWQFILLFAIAMWLVLLIRHIPEFRRIKRGEAKAWKSLKTKEMLK